MKLATWNINSLTVRLPQVLDWLAANPVDVLCLQELKLTDDKFPLRRAAGRRLPRAVFGQKTYNGVAILSRTPARDVVKNIPGFTDEQSRVIAATVDMPRAARSGSSTATSSTARRRAAKSSTTRCTGWTACATGCAGELVAHPQLVLLGDFNITFEDRDAFDPVGLNDTIHHTEEERAALSGADRAGPDRRFPPVRAAREELLLVGLPHARLPEQPRPAHRPHPGERGAQAAGAQPA